MFNSTATADQNDAVRDRAFAAFDAANIAAVVPTRSMFGEPMERPGHVNVDGVFAPTLATVMNAAKGLALAPPRSPRTPAPSPATPTATNAAPPPVSDPARDRAAAEYDRDKGIRSAYPNRDDYLNRRAPALANAAGGGGSPPSGAGTASAAAPEPDPLVEQQYRNNWACDLGGCRRRFKTEAEYANHQRTEAARIAALAEG